MYNKKSFMLLVLVIILFSAGCGKKKDSDSVADSWTDAKTAVESEIEVAETNILGEILIKAQIPEIEGEELTTDEQLANLILEKTLIEEMDENENFLFVKITYPDVGELLSERDMGGTPYEEEEILKMLLQSLKEDQVEYVTEEFKIMYETGTDKIVWDENLMNAMSGGLFGLFVEQE